MSLSMSTTSIGVLYWHRVVNPTMSLKYMVTSSYSSGSTMPLSFRLFTTGLRRQKPAGCYHGNQGPFLEVR